MSSSFAGVGDLLLTHAYTNVWCTPNQDKQSILKPAKLTPFNGSWRSVKVMWRQISLPDPTTRFHVYHLGQINPLLLGLLDTPNVWLKISDVCSSENIIVNLYTAKGYQLPKYTSWYMVTQDKDLILATRIPDKDKSSIDLNNEDLFVRLYSNAYYNSLRANTITDVIAVIGKDIVTQQDILDLQNQLNLYRIKPGQCQCIVNGMITDTIDLINVVLGDSVEFVYDASVKTVLSFNVSQLNDFTSTLDNIHKYLLHNPNDVQTIDYHDDIDIFLVKNLPNSTRYKGLYYHKNNEAAIRMVTHKDYSVPVPYLNAYLNSVTSWVNIDELRIIVQIRKSGYLRPLVYENNRVLDLYRMNEADVLSAMTGLNSVVDVWKAASLENSGYTALMRAKLGDITRSSVQTAYGYNAVSKLLGDTPNFTRALSNTVVADIPVGLQQGCSVYEYDINGLLLGYYIHNGGTTYVARNQTCKLIEAIDGFFSESLQIYRDQASTVLDLNWNYRFYSSDIIGGVSQNNWQDVTNVSQYAIIGNTATWAVSFNNKHTIVLSNKYHLTYALNYQATVGALSFTLREYRTDTQEYVTLPIPLGECDIFLNGYSLIRGLDYNVKFPVITITNKEYLIDPENQLQKIVIRLTGFCDANMQMNPNPDVGFVQYGVLSLNNQFNIRNDRVNRITVRGALYHYSQLQYGEENFEVKITDAKNGSPYVIRDIVVPMNSYLQTGSGQYIDPTYSLRNASKIIDTSISNYLTLKLPQKTPVSPSAITARYKLVSPFFNQIIVDLINGGLNDDQFVQQYSDTFVVTKLAPYLYLLDFDPLTDTNGVDPNFVVIHPHNLNHYVDMGIYQFKFLNRVQAIYGKGLIDIASSVRVAVII